MAPTPPSDFTPVVQSTSGLGGYPVDNADDRAFAFDGTSTGKCDYIFFYCPGLGRCSLLGQWDGKFQAIYEAKEGGIGGFDFTFRYDRALAFDYMSTGKMDHIFCFRPGSGCVFILSHDGQGNFTPVYAQGATDKPGPDGGNGWGGWDFRYNWDRCFAYDYDHSKKRDAMCIYRRYHGNFAIVKRNERGKWACAYQEFCLGIGGYIMGSESDYAQAYDYEHTGCWDHIIYCRPGSQKVSIIAHQGDKFPTIWNSGSGVGGFNFAGGDMRLTTYDFESSGKCDYLNCWQPGQGTLWCMTSPKHDGTWNVTYQQGSPGAGVGGYDLKSGDDRGLAFDYDHSGCMDYLLLYRVKSGIVWVLRRTSHVPKPPAPPPPPETEAPEAQGGWGNWQGQGWGGQWQQNEQWQQEPPPGIN